MITTPASKVYMQKLSGPEMISAPILLLFLHNSDTVLTPDNGIDV